MLTLDISALYALLARRDPDHGPMREALRADPGPWPVPAAVLGGTGCLVASRLGARVLGLFLKEGLKNSFFRPSPRPGTAAGRLMHTEMHDDTRKIRLF